jgi:superkiller protein 3
MIPNQQTHSSQSWCGRTACRLLVRHDGPPDGHTPANPPQTARHRNGRFLCATLVTAAILVGGCSVAGGPGGLLGHLTKPSRAVDEQRNRSVGPAGKPAAGHPPDLVAAIRELEAAGQTDEAVHMLDEVLRAAPDIDGGYELLAEIHAAHPHSDRALRALQGAAVRHPNDGNLLYYTGLALMQRGRWEEARGQFERAHIIAPDDVATTLALAGALLAIGRGDLATRALEAAAATEPAPGVSAMLGDLYVAQGRTPQAIAAYERSLRQDPQNLQTRCNLAFAYYHARRYESAVAAFAQLARHPHAWPDVAAYLAAGDCLMQLGRWSEARQAYEQAVAEEPQNLMAQLAVGFCALGMRDDAAAAAIGRQVAFADHSQLDAHRLLGMAAYHQGDYQAAFRHWDTALRLDTQDPVTYLLLGSALEQVGAAAEALVYARRAHELAPQDPVARSRIADLESRLAGREVLRR